MLNDHRKGKELLQVRQSSSFYLPYCIPHYCYICFSDSQTTESSLPKPPFIRNCHKCKNGFFCAKIVLTLWCHADDPFSLLGPEKIFQLPFYTFFENVNTPKSAFYDVLRVISWRVMPKTCSKSSCNDFPDSSRVYLMLYVGFRAYLVGDPFLRIWNQSAASDSCMLFAINKTLKLELWRKNLRSSFQVWKEFHLIPVTSS